MATSGTYAFGTATPQDDLIREAFERCGMEFSQVSGNQLDSARASLSYMASNWANRGPNLWTVSVESFPLTSGLQSVTLDENVIEILDAYVRNTSISPNQDLIITGISHSDYDALPYKAQIGDRPTQFFFDRVYPPVIYLWPVQNNANWELRLRVWKMTQDPGAFGNTMDAPQRWFDAMASDLAFRLSQKWAPQRMADLKTEARDAYAAAAAEDTENVPLRIVPNMMGGR